MIISKKISSFTDVITGGTPSTSNPEYWNGDIPWLNSGVLNDGDISKPSKFITERGLKSSSARLMPKDTVLIALTGSTTGQVAHLNIEAAANQSVTGILPSNEHHSRYLYYFLRSQRQKIKADAFGGAQPHINQQYVKDFKIPLPQLSDQIAIATLLSRVEALIATRKVNLRLLDEFLKATFLEMFGDPVRNEIAWDKKTTIDYASCIVPGRDKPKSFNGSIPWVTTNDLFHLGYTFSSKQGIGLTDEEIDQVRARVIPAGSILITCVGDLGVTSICGHDMVVNQQLHSFQVEDGMNNVFFMYAISFQKDYMYRNASQTTVPYMNKTVCNRIPMIAPPIGLQNQFAAIFEKAESLKVHYQKNLTELENLYGTLSQKAFKGELDLSRVPLPEFIKPSNNTQPVVTKIQADSDIILNEEMLDELRLINHELPRDLQQFFKDFINHQIGIFSMDDFWQKASQHILEIMGEDSKPLLGVSDYDNVKQWLFDLIKNGKVSQHFNETTNQIELSVNT